MTIATEIIFRTRLPFKNVHQRQSCSVEFLTHFYNYFSTDPLRIVISVFHHKQTNMQQFSNGFLS